MPADFRQEFIRFAVESNVLRFGEFKTKAGRLSPYFFNAGLFNHGAALKRLAQFYAKAIAASGVRYDMLFGPAYKGIPLAAAVAIIAALLAGIYPAWRMSRTPPAAARSTKAGRCSWTAR